MTRLVSLTVALLVPALVVGGITVGSRALKAGRAGGASSYPEKQIALGRQSFLTTCANCHSLKPGEQGHQGPNLSDIGAVAGTRVPGLDGPAYILESIIEPDAYKPPGVNGEMPENLHASFTADRVRQLVAFLMSQGGAVDASRIASLDVPEAGHVPVEEPFEFSLAQIRRGEDLFRGKAGCINCHSTQIRLEYQQHAPILFHAGHGDADRLRESIVDPSSQVEPRYQQMLVAMADGTVVEGRLIARDDRTITLVSTGQDGRPSTVAVPLDEVDRDEDGEPLAKPSGSSPMPLGYEDLLEPDELNDLIAFIRALN